MCACIAYTATYNGEEDIYFVRAELPILAQVTLLTGTTRISWNGLPGVSYCVQALADLHLPWSVATNVACVVATPSTPFVDAAQARNTGQRYCRVGGQP